jgi:hypothetical protein
MSVLSTTCTSTSARKEASNSKVYASISGQGGHVDDSRREGVERGNQHHTRALQQQVVE